MIVSQSFGGFLYTMEIGFEFAEQGPFDQQTNGFAHDNLQFDAM